MIERPYTLPPADKYRIAVAHPSSSQVAESNAPSNNAVPLKSGPPTPIGTLGIHPNENKMLRSPRFEGKRFSWGSRSGLQTPPI